MHVHEGYAFPVLIFFYGCGGRNAVLHIYQWICKAFDKGLQNMGRASVLSTVKSLIRNTKPLYRAVNRLRGMRIHHAKLVRDYQILGSDYGGWAINTNLLTTSSIVYSFGVGQDITFDIALIAAVGCRVYGFDPTPIAVDWIKRQTLPGEFIFDPTGLGAEDCAMEFNIPPVEGWHSFSKSPDPSAQRVGQISCPVRRLSTIMQRYQHSHVDLLKMDIEGFEYSVLNNILEENIRPTTLLVEFHHGSYGIRNCETKRAVKNLERFGYASYWVSDAGKEYAFELVR